ncbi:hypothetical protein [Streptomyces sp. PR69]|uniref:hypothetical protein n=1 Tax=Streptomyces sp. PR69 TaxID=2984950 RepID=UPI00226487A6|nr:hypothetical protein [Streptomyces sp. PR69]
MRIDGNRARLVSGGTAILAASTLLLTAAPLAHAGGKPRSTSLPGGAKLTSNIWYSNSLSFRGCGDYQVSAVISGGKAPRSGKDNVKTRVTATGYGVAWNGSPLTSGTLDKSVTNNKGQRGAYLKGSKCYGMTTVYVTYNNTASTFYYGTHRNVSAS